MSHILFVAVLALKSPAAPAAVTLVKGGDLHVGDGTVVEDATIIIRDGKFAAVGGPELTAPSNSGVTLVDARGKIITPGLVASDNQLGLVEIDLEGSTHDDARGGDHPVRAAYDASRAFNAESSLIQVQAIGGVTTAAVAPAGGLLSGQVAWVDLVHGDHRGALSKAGVAIDGNLGHSYGGSRAAALAKLHEVLTDAQVFRGRKDAYERAQTRPFAAHALDLQALQPALAGQIPLTLSADRASDILAALDLAKEYKLRLVIVGGSEAWKVAPELAAAKVPVVLQPTRNLPGSFDTLGARLDTAALLAAAGVPVVIAWLDDSHNLRNITQEAGIAVANGLPWAAALRAITLEPALAYGQGTTHGSVAVGKVANLVVWSGDPLELSSRPTDVLVRGRAIPMVSRQTLLRDRYRSLDKFGAAAPSTNSNARPRPDTGAAATTATTAAPPQK
ncbi:amidohydrolase family protein [Nannocystis bainbridge]|uniref:Amidohydrolase family protein n=1 Tax=Nannocystis bainbridge TaxID=2995303 RepID=A0ABT5E9K3_9BACT|nr:amidohydrolase family protein [Nannocystis bainbridge]MDC0722547.1 amidohydrolase family protein [Nannocystis bainbridge]